MPGCSDRVAYTFECSVTRACNPWGGTRSGKTKYSLLIWRYTLMPISVLEESQTSLFRHVPRVAKVKPGQLETGLWTAQGDTAG